MSVLSRTSLALASLAIVAAACGPSGERQPISAAQRAASLDVAGPPTKTELAMFAPLPARVSPAGSPATPAQIALGRKLYYETMLSNGHDVSCNSCHPLNAFGADGRARSLGDHGQPGGRNAPTVYNAAGHVAQFWDGRAPTVEEQAKGPILNPAEMGMPDEKAVLAHLRASPEYRAAFRAAFPGETEPVSYDNLGRAIGAFERGLVTPAPWDAYLAGDRGALNEQELRGFRTFVAAGCAGCHNGANVGGGSYQKAGLATAWPTLADSGRYAVTKKASDLYVFKIPALRNVAQTGPYFHDGSVAALDEAVRMMSRHQVGRELTAAQVADITAWLKTLTGKLPVAYIAEPPLPKGSAAN